MTNTANVHDSSPVRGGPADTAKEHDDKIKGSAAAVSLAEIEELFQTLEDQKEANSTGKKLKTSEEELAQQIVELVQEIEGAGSGKGSGKTSAAMGKLQQYAKAFAAGDNSALDKILSLVMPSVLLYSQNNPNDIMSVIKAYAPLMKDAGANVVSKVKEADEAFGKFQSLYAADSDPKKGAKLASLFGAIHDTSSSKEIEEQFKRFEPKFKQMIDHDQAKAAEIISTLFLALQISGAQGGVRIKQFVDAFLASGSLDNLMYMSMGELKSALSRILFVVKGVSAEQITASDGSEEILELTTPQPPSGKAPSGKSGAGGKTPPPPPPPPPPPVPQTFFSEDQRKKAEKDVNQDISQILAQAMASMQMLQSMLSKTQADQNKYGIVMNQAKTRAALQNMQDLQKKIQKEIDEQNKAKHQPWWSWLIKAIVAVVAVIVAAVTAGVGAAIAAALIGVFMATPLMGMTVKAIATKIAKDLYNSEYDKCKAEGMSDADAKKAATEKSNAVAQVIAQVIVIIAVAVVSFGVGGIEATGEGATNTALAAGEDATEDVADEVTNEVVDEATSESTEGADAAESGSKTFRFNSRLAGKVAAFQGLSAVGGTNLWMSIMQTDPAWCKKHKKLMMALDIVAQVITMICAMVAGASAMSSATKGPQLAEAAASMYAKSAKYFLAVNAIMQAGEGAYGVYSGTKSAGYLQSASDLATEIGQDQAEMIRLYGEIGVLQNVSKQTNKESMGMIKSDGEIMDALQDGAGSDSDVVNRALAGAG